MGDIIKLVEITTRMNRNKFMKPLYPDVNSIVYNQLSNILERLKNIENEIKEIYIILSLKNEQKPIDEID